MLKNLLIIYIGAFLLFSLNANAEKLPQAEKIKRTNEIIKKYKTTGDLFAEIITSNGSIFVKLFYKKSPLTVENFVGLAEGTKSWTKFEMGKPIEMTKPFYDGLSFHRIVPNFIIQAGFMEGDGTKAIDEEFSPYLSHDKKGIVSMAKTAPDTNGSQFFITLKPAKFLDKKHIIFGEVVKGMEVVDSIARIKTYPNDRPRKTIKIITVKIHKSKLPEEATIIEEEKTDSLEENKIIEKPNEKIESPKDSAETKSKALSEEIKTKEAKTNSN